MGNNEIIKGQNTSYTRYEELINRRDDLRKKAFQYQAAYVSIFGDLIIELFRKKIECIRKKKTIEYCQASLNHGKTVEQEKLQEYLEQEMADFNKQLDNMVKEHKASLASTVLTEIELSEIKRIYHRLVKMIHPDMNPSVAKSEELMDLWNRVVVCYDCNDLTGLQELEVLVTKAVSAASLEEADIMIPNIEEKISDIEKQIRTIMETDPYQYKFLLDDKELVEKKRQELRCELKEYEEYSNQLDEVLEGIIGSGVKITWQMSLK
ncbi:MAG: J domain-containing protein [Butyrivibrio sp.]|nr:J domain-containing protein [Butyrivibrio sp.]